MVKRDQVLKDWKHVACKDVANFVRRVKLQKNRVQKYNKKET